MAGVVRHMELARSGIKALDMLHQCVFDLVLLDIDMPELNGVDTARHIRHSDTYDILVQNRNVPIVAVTTNDTVDWKKAYAQAGMNGCISKPIIPDILKQTLFQVLHHGISRESLQP